MIKIGVEKISSWIVLIRFCMPYKRYLMNFLLVVVK